MDARLTSEPTVTAAVVVLAGLALVVSTLWVVAHRVKDPAPAWGEDSVAVGVPTPDPA